MYFEVWMPEVLKSQPTALIETFARFQAGSLSSEDFHGFLSIFMVFHRFPSIFIDCHGFRLIFMYFEVWMLKVFKVT